MEASTRPRKRRRRYEPQPSDRPLTLTPSKFGLLKWVAELRIATTAQLAACSNVSHKSARNHLRDLLDAGFVRVVPTSRFGLINPGESDDPANYYGSAPNIYVLTPAGGRVLRRAGVLNEDDYPERCTPRSSLFIAHELAIRDVRVWAALAERQHSGHALERWQAGGEAAIELSAQGAVRSVRPDAWFVYRMGERVLVGLVEVDRGTERGATRWSEKLTAYHALFASGRLQEVTGLANARVLVFATGVRRRDQLADFVAKQARPGLAERFWFVDLHTLGEVTLVSPHWRVPNSAILTALLPPAVVNASKGVSR